MKVEKVWLDSGISVPSKVKIIPRNTCFTYKIHALLVKIIPRNTCFTIPFINYK